MNIIDKTKQYYEKLNIENGYGSPNNLWSNVEKQIVRFQKAVTIFDFSNKEILDVGCGYGDFYNYLLKKKFYQNRIQALIYFNNIVI